MQRSNKNWSADNSSLLLGLSLLLALKKREEEKSRMAWCWEQGILAQVLADNIGYLPANLYGFEVQQVEAELTSHLGASPLLVTRNWTSCFR